MSYIVIKVQRGENARSIARKYNTTERSIYKLNNPMFFEGERLLIKVEEGRLHTVQPFEDIKIISEKYKVSAEQLTRLNGSDKFYLGETILIDEK